MTNPVPWVKYEKIDDNHGRFIASPLRRGMGVTLGNSLRRVLLSSLGGHAITSVMIDGCEHEFSSIPNVVEDVFDVVCNLKNVVFKSDSDEPKTLKIEVKGSAKVTAKDIQTDSEVKIINPNQYIAEVSDGGKLKIEIQLEKGYGYASSADNEKEESAINTIEIDSSFSPILRVNHQVEKTRVGEDLDYENLTLDVWTDGSVTSEDAVKEAANLLANKFQLFTALNEKPAQPEESSVEEVVDAGSNSALNLSIDDLELSARSSNCLKRAGIETVAELVEKDMAELSQIKNFGKKSSDEINDKLKQYGLALNDGVSAA